MRMLLALLLSAVCGIAVLAPAHPAEAELSRCRIGKPSYCFKYGGTLCQQWNTTTDNKSACEAWTGACLDCHGAISGCLGTQSVPTGSKHCERCTKAWLACMAKIDAAHWKNRMTR